MIFGIRRSKKVGDIHDRGEEGNGFRNHFIIWKTRYGTAGAREMVPDTISPHHFPALDAHGKAAPYTGPDDEPQAKGNFAHVCALDM